MSKMLRSDAKVVPLEHCQSLAPTGKDKDLVVGDENSAYFDIFTCALLAGFEKIKSKL
jgi:hypothetical protein